MFINLQAFAAQLHSLRVKRDFTQEHLAELCNLSPHYVGNLEQGVRKPSLDCVMQLCSALGTTPNQLFKDSISAEMQNGTPVPVTDETLLRSFMDMLPDLLSDALPYDEDEEFTLFGVPAHRIATVPETPDQETLTDLLLVTNPNLLASKS